ncbi:PcfJ domain-containing protein [Bradyrhizobium agreste]|uniref:PcfJ domain-containing protein n=1 Tax=Bradyrhizobium agreste TaxID=2751811 RepID=UPI001FEBD7CD|nr:PcfJ domain-containing protein [Bradyrhizobium agreste]
MRLICLWAWFSSQPTTLGHDLIERPWTPDLRIDAARSAAENWRTVFALHTNLGRLPIADMWLRPGRMAGYEFVPLDGIAAITEEAKAMRNCLNSYGGDLAHNRSRLWSIRKDGERVATLRIARRYRDPLPNIVELEGPGNATASQELWWAARQWLHKHDLSQIDMRQHAWQTAPLDRESWVSPWRPYWLAKRRIPDWLPMAPSRKALEAL